MASLHRRSGTKVWQCSFDFPTKDGVSKQHRQSTGTTNRRDAERRASELERQARKLAGLDSGTAQKIQGILNRAGEDALKERLTVAKAWAYICEVLKEASGEDLTEFSVRQWVTEWLDRKRSQVSQTSQSRYEMSARAFLKWLGDRADKPLESITTTHLRQYRDFLCPGREPLSVNAYLADVRASDKVALNEGLVLANPAAPIEGLAVTPRKKIP